MKLSEKIQEALREQQEINLSDPAVQKRLAAQWGYVPAETQPAPSIKDAIIDDLQSQFDTEGITEHDSGDALIRLSDAIAAVEDNFAQPAPSVPEAVMAALENLDDYIARIEGNDRGACNPINLIRRYLLDAAEVGGNK